MTSKTKKLSKVIVFLIAFAMLIALLPLTLASAADVEYSLDGTVATVYSGDGFEAAVKHEKVNKIILGGHISVNVNTLINTDRLSNTLVIDGGTGYYELRQYEPSWDLLGLTEFLPNLTIANSGTLTNVVFQNMKIEGKNDAGVLFINPLIGIISEPIDISFKNVDYAGPALVQNEFGDVRIEDSSILIRPVLKDGLFQKGWYVGNVARASNVILAGTVNIRKVADETIIGTIFGSGSIFRLNILAGLFQESYIKVEKGANVVIDNMNWAQTNVSGLVHSDVLYDFIVEDNANFTYAGYRSVDDNLLSNVVDMMQDLTIGKNASYELYVDGRTQAGLCELGQISANNIVVGEGGNFLVHTRGGSLYGSVRVRKDLTVNKDATFKVIADGNDTVSLGTLFTMSAPLNLAYGGTVTLNNPAEFLIYNYDDGNILTNFVGGVQAITYGAQIGINFDGYWKGTVNSIEYWNTAAGSGYPQLSNPSAWWRNGEGQLFTYEGTVNKGDDISFDTFSAVNYNGQGGQSLPLTSAAVNMINVNVVRIRGTGYDPNKLPGVFTVTEKHVDEDGDLVQPTTEKQVAALQSRYTYTGTTSVKGWDYIGYSTSLNSTIQHGMVPQNLTILGDTEIIFHYNTNSDLARITVQAVEKVTGNVLSSTTTKEVKGTVITVYAPEVDPYIHDPKEAAEVTFEVTKNETITFNYVKALYPDLEDEHVVYINGYPDRTVRPDGTITRAEAVTILYNLITKEYKAANPMDTSKTFADVSRNQWFYTQITTLVTYKIVAGYPDGTFRPDEQITRAEFVALVSRFDDLAPGTISYSDVGTTHWAYAYIVNATAKGWIAGNPDGTFRPDELLTRAEAVKITNRVLGRVIDARGIPADTPIPFVDVARSQWFFADIMEASVEHTFYIDPDGDANWY